VHKSGILLAVTISIFTAGCITGQGSDTPSPDSYPLQIQAQTLKFGDVTQPQDQDGLHANLNVRDNLPELYYRYEITSRVNGEYFMMPNPPKLYTVYRIPFYKNNPPEPVIKLTFTNNSQQVLATDHSICAFDLDGQTVLSQPIKLPDLLPGHTLVALIDGPTFDKLQGHDTLTVWVYHLGTQPNAAPYKWVVPYQLTQQTRPAQAKLVGQSPKEVDVERFKGRIDPATTDSPP
jgi:hypothetical protein